MRRNTIFILVAIFTLGFLLHLTYQHTFYWFLGAMIIFAVVSTYDILQKKNSILRNYPLFGHFRYLLKEIAPEIRQYFIESNVDGTPFNKNEIALVNGRANKKEKTRPFGTEENLYEDGHEWISHSQFPKKTDAYHPFITIGSKFCKQPYQASLLNISAMSYGSLSANAILALNSAAQQGGFYHNTGEGSVTPYHTKMQGDLVWQIGTGYFGCRTEKGTFSLKKFKDIAKSFQIKMIEIKISQGAKPGHGGILPAEKNTKEIAKIRGVKVHTTVFSPPYHSAFTNNTELLDFIETLRENSNGKPIGFKLCIGNKREIKDLVELMAKTQRYPDFINVDGAEGGTGAAPLEFSNHIGMPGQEAVIYLCDLLNGYGLKKEITVIYSGKVLSGFDIVRALAAGADLCNSARAMMFALGCIQSLRCHLNNCPTGIATQNKLLAQGLDVKYKAERVKNFHEETIEAALEMIAATGVNTINDLNRNNIFQWSGENNRSMSLNEIYPDITYDSYLNKTS